LGEEEEETASPVHPFASLTPEYPYRLETDRKIQITDRKINLPTGK
jgi:hypothetical protein